ncbi:MAG: tautomerase family protein [Devosia sp.]
MMIIVKMEKGRNDDTKRRAAEALTKAAVEGLATKASGCHVLFDDYTKENWAIGGELQLDRRGPGPVTNGNRE